MLGLVNLPLDLGSLGLQSFRTAGPVIATLSADDIDAQTLLQLEELGSRFHVNGPHARRVSDLLRRHGSVGLERLGLALGWRKGDAASFMAASAGGQAISLLSVCLMNVLDQHKVSRLLMDLCDDMIPSKRALSSIPQLARGANLMSEKLAVLGFGNFFAQQACRIHDTYQQFKLEFPYDQFLERMSPKTAFILLRSMSRALREDDTIVRITGMASMGYFLALSLFLFPRDVKVSVEGTVTHEGPRASVIIEVISSSRAMPTQIQLETAKHRSTPIILQQKSVGVRFRLHYGWTGWLADYLRVRCLTYGFRCSQEFLDVFYDVLTLLPGCVFVSDTPDNLGPNLLSRLGAQPQLRMRQVCEEILCDCPKVLSEDIATASSRLWLALFKSHTLQCFCNTCYPRSDGRHKDSDPWCKKEALRSTITTGLCWGLICFFISSRPNNTICPNEEGMDRLKSIVFDVISDVRYRTPKAEQKDLGIDLYSFHDYILAIQEKEDEHVSSLIRSSGSSTVFASALQTFRPSRDGGILFEMIDGHIIFKGRQYTVLYGMGSTTSVARSGFSEESVIPSSVGAHSSLVFTFRETLDGLSLRVTARVSGREAVLDLRGVIVGSFMLKRARRCPHPLMHPLRREYAANSVEASVTSPLGNGRVSIAMTKSDPTAQFLCCTGVEPALLQKDCCLNCAFGEAAGLKIRAIIVGIP